ncbi:sensor histidine kinase [Chitinophaga silvisoli]|uniref:histidine kinase n=2 Tax=Chitinophaga silvisoli TaxID=2291814 RepID=A0A3E1NSJ5_9BACT|nr:sensor histidine kinase [Chitinophaga silvisoli]
MYGKVKLAFENNFILRLSTGATSLLQKTSVNPVTLALPQADERFLLTYDNTIRTDTLFNNLPSGRDFMTDSIQKNSKDWRIRKSKKLETGGTLTIVYALPAGNYNTSIQQLQSLLLIYIPSAIIISIITGYFLSGFFLLPLKKIIKKANHTDLTASIQLLEEPIFKDELHELTVALNRMLERIDHQSQLQNAFFAAASHELRTPLSNMLTELQTTAAAESSAQLIKNQVEEVQRLKKLVDNFLLMSRLKAKNVPVNKTRISIAELCMEIMERMQNEAYEHKLRFMLHVSPTDEELFVSADKDHLSIILGNLFSNCIKYSVADTVIRVDLLKQDGIVLTIQNETELVISDVKSLQEQFTRVENYKEGFGLGLWIATRLGEINDIRLALNYHDSVFRAVLHM